LVLNSNQIMQKRKDLKSFLTFSWGSGSDIALWSYASKDKKSIRQSTNRPKEALPNGAILAETQDFDKSECDVELFRRVLILKIIEAFAQNLYEYSIAKLRIFQSEISKYQMSSPQSFLSDKKKDEIFLRSQETNFGYLSALKKTAENYENTDLHKVMSF
jgi:hypothetical protein